MSQWTVDKLDNDQALIVTIGDTVTWHIGNYATTADTATDRYINIQDSDAGLCGFHIFGDQDFQITVVNDRIFKVPMAIPVATATAPGGFTVKRGNWRNIKVESTVANTTITIRMVI